ncbi:MAG: ATP-binding cassette domain-containing protein [Verrucomicrobiota bacterium]
MLTISNLSKAFGGRELYREASLQVNRGECIGLVGPNGAGKSTLFNIMLGHESADTGTISIERGIDIGYLPQETAPIDDETVLELALKLEEGGLGAAYQTMCQCERRGEEESEPYHNAQEIFLECDGYRLEAKAKKILNGLAFKEDAFVRPARELSGGWVMRAHLARLLVMEPDLLMLDEPTNHLDLETVGWFQSYLKNYAGALLLISHDREFLNDMISHVVAIRHKQVKRYKGNYDDYLDQREAEDAQHEAAYKNQQKEMQRIRQSAEKFRAKARRASQAQSKLKALDRMEKLDAPLKGDRVMRSFSFPQPESSGQVVCTLENVDFAYGSHQVYQGLNIEIQKGQKTVLVGPNGAGKSTLLKLMGKMLEPQAGQRRIGHHVHEGYFAQQRAEMFSSSRTVLEEAMDLSGIVSEETARTILGAMLFSGDDAFKTVGVLSGGEKSRLALAKLLLDPPNFMLLDEPTTHLDLDSVDSLISALNQYEGTVVFISHDVHFIRSVAETVWHVHHGSVTSYAGNYDYFLEKTNAVDARHAIVQSGSKESDEAEVEVLADNANTKRKSKEQKRQEAEQRQVRSKQKKQLEQKVEELEKKVVQLEISQRTLLKEMQQPETHKDSERMKEINVELKDVQERLYMANTAWERESEVLMEMLEQD